LFSQGLRRLDEGSREVSTLSADDKYTGLKLPPVSPPVSVGVRPPIVPRPVVDDGRRIRELEEEREQLLAQAARFEEREQALVHAAEAIEAQRAKLVAVREEYEQRRRLLDERSADLARERTRLEHLESDLTHVRERLEARALELDAREAALVEVPVAVAVAVAPEAPKPRVARVRVVDGAREPKTIWWAPTLGRPLEAA
jgi:hypothetical protein